MVWKTPSGRINALASPNHTFETAAGPGVQSKLAPSFENVKADGSVFHVIEL